MDRGPQQKRRKLTQIQRIALIRVTRENRTISYKACQVLAGVPPVDLVLKEQEVRDTYRKEGINGVPPGIRQLIEANPTNWKEVIHELYSQEWDHRWVTVGAPLRRFFPTVKDRETATWVERNCWVSQLLTGLEPNSSCINEQQIRLAHKKTHCNKKTSEHIITECRRSPLQAHETNWDL